MQVSDLKVTLDYLLVQVSDLKVTLDYLLVQVSDLFKRENVMYRTLSHKTTVIKIELV